MVWENFYRSTGSPTTSNSSFCWSFDSFSNSFCWAQELSWYQVWSDYRQGKANRATDTLSRFYLMGGNSSSREQSNLLPAQWCLYTKFLPTEHTSSLYYFNFGDAFRKKTAQSIIRAEMLNRTGRCLGGWGSYILQRYYDEVTPTSRELNKSLPKNVSRYQYLLSGKGTSYNSISVIIEDLSMDYVTDCHIHGLESHQLRSDSRHWRIIRWISAYINWCTWLAEFFTPFDSMSATKIQSSPSPGTTFELDYGYHLRTFYQNINPHPD